MKWNQTIESVMKYVFLVAAVFSIAAVILICFFLFANGIPAIREIGVVKFLLGTTWAPSNNEYGILPMIVGSLYITAGAILFGVPIGILTSVFMTFYCPKKIYRPLKSATELLAGIPSVVYGFFGMIVLVPAVYRFEKMLDISGKGNSIFTASLLLGIMILPSIIGVCESALRAVLLRRLFGTRRNKGKNDLQGDSSSSFQWCSGWGCPWNRKSNRRNHGSCHDRWKPAAYSDIHLQRCAYNDSQHCHRNGICNRSAPGIPDRNRCCSVCIHTSDQRKCCCIKTKAGRTCIKNI